MNQEFVIGLVIGILIGQIPVLVAVYCRIKGIKTRLNSYL